ncbi:MAG: type II toxin-antitoxin system RelE/ParE family toxin [Aquisalinus sp.]|nr:type II toxin-antitoxin system RelE/ParE family toxin [Aquisalinus sp.]
MKHFGEAQADTYYFELFERFQKIADNPMLYPAVDHIRQGYRRSVYGKEAIYYKLTEGGVLIVSILRHQNTDDKIS